MAHPDFGTALVFSSLVPTCRKATASLRLSDKPEQVNYPMCANLQTWTKKSYVFA